MKNKRVLITGGLGFIGSNLAEKCLRLGAKVTIYDNLDSNSGGNLYNISGFKNEVNLIIGDILNYDSLAQLIISSDIIINCAASTSHPYSMREPWLNLDVNSRGVINILEIIRRFNKEVKFVHIGTSTQLGKLHYRPADENHPEFPTDIYSSNKMVSEKYVLIYAKAYDLNATVIRLPNVFGPRASIHSPEFTFNNYFIGLALQNKNITVYKPGNQLRNVLYVQDAVDALIQAAISDQVNKDVFFAVGDSHYTVAQIAEKTTEILGGKVQYIDWPQERKAIDIGDAVLSNNKFKNIVGWNPSVSFEEGLINTKEFYSKCLEKYLR